MTGSNGARTGQRHRLRGAISALAVAAVLGGCNSAPEPKIAFVKGVAQGRAATETTQPKEYFPQAVYGVKASPRVSSNTRSRMKRGGGRYLVGKPYQVRGKWYYPKEISSYRKTGMASWYGSAFHGRLTANGEVYDMHGLTAAHPTMPLPSYARVTNLANGASVMVRVNDRGPFHGGRIMDLSQRAAELLDYKHSGTAKIDVEYVGPAPIEGHDEQYLMASYNPGGAKPAPSGATMVAMSGPVPQSGVGPAAAFPGQLVDNGPMAAPLSDPVLPELGPMIEPRPGKPLLATGNPLAYAGSAGAQPFDLVDSGRESEGWKDANPVYVSLGAFENDGDAGRIASALADLARVDRETVVLDGRALTALTATPKSPADLDLVLRTAWQAGADGAFAVRDR
ncbi:MAG: septal ring lytic transglycosylase RlpA family protein [Rhizobiaceae bacterium]